jgi:RNA-directed DNA polymerase
MGLVLKPNKTRIGHTLHPVDGTAGFDFLSFHVRQYPVGHTKTGKTGQGIPLGFKTFIRPSKAGQRRPIRRMHEEVRRLRASSQEVPIKRLNPIIQGWSNSYATVASKKTFVRMDTALNANLRRWAYRRHPHKSAWWVSEKYWHPRHGQWTFKTTNGIQLRRHSATAIRRYTKVAGMRSPYGGDLGLLGKPPGQTSGNAAQVGHPAQTAKRTMLVVQKSTVKQGRQLAGVLFYRSLRSVGAGGG